MSTDIALENPIELKVVDYDPSETDKEEDPDPFILFRMLLNGHRVLEEFEVKTDEIFHIKEQFESVSTTLKLIDAMNFPSYKKVREMYAPKWVPIYKNYQELISKLHDSATNDYRLVNKYLTVIIPILGDPEVPYGDKQLKLQSFIDDLEKTEKTTQSTFCAEFAKMQSAHKEFSTNLREFSIDVGASATDEMEKTLKEIEKLEKKLDDLKGKCKDLFPNIINPLEIVGLVGISGVAQYATASVAVLSETALAGAASCLASVSLVAPTAILNILGRAVYKVFQGVEVVNEQREAFGEMIETTALHKAKRAKLAALTAEKVETKALELSVATTIGNIDDLMPRLGNFVDVLPILKKDAQEIRKFIESLKNDPKELQEKLQSQLDLISQVYSLFEDMLRTFSFKSVSLAWRPGGAEGENRCIGSKGEDQFEDSDRSVTEVGGDDPGGDKDPLKRPQFKSSILVHRLFRAFIQYISSIQQFINDLKDRRLINEEVPKSRRNQAEIWLEGFLPIAARFGSAYAGQALTEAHVSEFIQEYTSHSVHFLDMCDFYSRHKDLSRRHANIMTAGRILLDQLTRLRVSCGPFSYRLRR